jgi:hypothetical protein
MTILKIVLIYFVVIGYCYLALNTFKTINKTSKAIEAVK